MPDFYSKVVISNAIILLVDVPEVCISLINRFGEGAFIFFPFPFLPPSFINFLIQ